MSLRSKNAGARRCDTLPKCHNAALVPPFPALKFSNSFTQNKIYEEIIMKLKFFASLFAFVAAVLIAASSASAQTATETWANVEAVKIKSPLIVETKTGAIVKGKVTSVTATTLNLSSGGKAVALERDDIAKVYRGKKSSRLKRALIGAGIGLGIGAGISGVYVLVKRDGDPLAAGAGLIYGFLVGVPVGAVVGAATGGKSRKGVLLYEAR